VLPVALQGPVDLPATISLSCVLQSGADGLRRCFYNSIALGPGVNIGLTGLNGALNFQVSDIHYSQSSRTVRVHVRVLAPTDLSGQVKAGDRDVGAKAFAAGVMATLVSATPGGGPNGLIAVLSIEAEETATGWIYKGKPVKVGARITFETERYTMEGVITAAEFPKAQP